MGWAITQYKLGDVLERLSDNEVYDEETKERGKQHLKAAIDAYREALKVTPLEYLPMFWANLQTHVADELHQV
jgi:hypothetical protein